MLVSFHMIEIVKGFIFIYYCLSLVLLFIYSVITCVGAEDVVKMFRVGQCGKSLTAWLCGLA